jgi:hypothetical protein
MFDAVDPQLSALYVVAYHVNWLGEAELLNLPGSTFEVDPDFVRAEVCRPATPARCGLAGFGVIDDNDTEALLFVGPSDGWHNILGSAEQKLGAVRKPSDCEVAVSFYLSCDELPADRLARLTFTTRDTPTVPPKVEVRCSSASLVSADALTTQPDKGDPPDTARPTADPRY